MKLYFYLFFLVVTMTNCKAQVVNNVVDLEKRTIPYSFNSPDRTFEMPEVLNEISGLSLSPNQNQLIAINDEQGVIFFIDKNDGAIVREVKFYKNGDYEGIEFVGENVFIVKSSGTVFKVEELESDSVKFTKSKYLLKKENDTEGLGFDVKNNQLLFACKGRGCLHEGCTLDDCRMKKSIYSLNLDNNSIGEKPVFEISIADVKAYLTKNKKGKDLEKFDAFINPENDKLHFHPSALAVHPITNHIYILSSKGKTLIVLQSDGKIIFMEKLKKKIHAQPEGIVFDLDGTMYISNEGKKGGKGKIYTFKYKR